MGCFFCRRFEDNATTSKSAFRPLALSLYSGQARLHVRCPPRRRCLTSPLFDIYSALLRFTPLYSALLHSTPLYSALICSTLLYSALLGARGGSARAAALLGARGGSRRALRLGAPLSSLARVTRLRASHSRARASPARVDSSHRRGCCRLRRLGVRGGSRRARRLSSAHAAALGVRCGSARRSRRLRASLARARHSLARARHPRVSTFHIVAAVVGCGGSARAASLGARGGSPRRTRLLSACAAARRAALVTCARHSRARVTLSCARVTRACRLFTLSRPLSAAAARRARRLSARAAALLCAVNWNRRCFKFLRRKRRKEPNRLTRTTLV